MFRRSERPDSDAATQGFLALDDEQRAAADAVHAAEELGTAELGGGRKLADAWAQVAAVGDRATEAYLTATSEFPLDGPALPAARAADERALREVEAARDAIRRFRATHARTLDEAAFLLTSLPRTVQEAQAAVLDARTAVQQAEAAGTRSRRASERLAEAEQVAIRLTGTGLRERRALAQQVIDLARSAATLAAEAPRTASSVRSALGSVATRREATAGKAERIEPAMSALLREFSEPCSHDLTGAHAHAVEAIAAADRAIAAAHRQGAAGDWDDAADAVATARSELGHAEQRHDAVLGRLAELRDVRADPGKHATDTRFVLRDAQRLVVDRGLVAEFGPILDAQSVRLENARERLTGTHPDYWFYLTELRSVHDRVKDVVARARAAHAR